MPLPITIFEIFISKVTDPVSVIETYILRSLLAVNSKNVFVFLLLETRITKCRQIYSQICFLKAQRQTTTKNSVLFKRRAGMLETRKICHVVGSATLKGFYS